MRLLGFLLFYVHWTIHASHGSHEIKHLPHFHGSFDFKHYAGHVGLDSGENLFYWYTEAQHKPETAPIVLWLNGGPGCSSLGGFFTENGPFVAVGNEDLRLNKYSWNRHVNMVWLESPSGVGFSQPLQKQGYNDTYTASKNRQFLVHFFNRYPNLKNRKFYITGESYAGIYIPSLVNMLVENPIEGVNLQGFAVGNPYTDSVIDSSAYMEYYYTHGLISLEKYNEVKAACKERYTCFFYKRDCSEECNTAIDEAIFESDEEKFNHYNIYGDTCQIEDGQIGMLHASRPSRKSKNTKILRRGKFSPCIDKYTEEYLNKHNVQKAIHASLDGSLKTWRGCNSNISLLYKGTESALPLYRSFLNKGLKVLIYSGDTDSVVNFIGTQRWIVNGLGLKVKSGWKAWYSPDQQLSGYTQDYEGLTFTTVKGAGHMVPTTKPLHALYMFECFIFQECDNFEYPHDVYQAIAKGGNGGDYISAVSLVSSSVSPFVFFMVISVTITLYAIGRKLNIIGRRDGYLRINN